MRALLTPRRLTVAVLTAAASVVVVAIPTALLDTPWFSREIPPTWWAWPALLVTSVIGGLLAASYVADPSTAPADAVRPAGQRRGAAGAVLTFFAVGCPVCNKLVLLALGYTGAIAWFAPVQPVLQLAAVLLLSWALVQRLRTADRCSIPLPSPTSIPEP